MTSLCGRYCKTFRDATHAVVLGIHMDARWDVTWAAIEACTDTHVTLEQVGKLRILRDEQGFEFVRVRNQCPMGRLFGNRATLHRARPFIDQASAARRKAAAGLAPESSTSSTSTSTP